MKTGIRLALAALALCGWAAQAMAAAGIDTQARNAIIVDFETGAVLLDKGADQRMPPASMSKIMTAYLVYDALKKGKLSLEDILPVSEKAWRTQGSKMFVPYPGRVKVEDLVRGMIVQSGNDACIVLAEGLAGSEEAFVEQENEKAKELGLNSSHFANVSGLPDPNEYVTARDLALLARRLIVDFPEYYHYDAEKDFAYNNIRQGNRNPLLYKDLGADGMKTGHTEEAGYSLTASAIREGRRIIMVLGGLPSMKARAQESERLLEWAFREFNDFRLVKAGDTIDQADVWLGAEAKVPVTATKDVVVTLPRAARRSLKATVHYDGPAKAPIAKGQTVGKLTLTADGVDPVEVPLVAMQPVEKLGPIARIAVAAGYLVWGKRWSRGRFITLEGGEGAGKSTHAGLLVEALRQAGQAALQTREPGGAPGAEEIRRLLVEGPPQRWDAETEALLMVAARRTHLVESIWPALERGDWVICDRFADSTLAYQGYGRGLPPTALASLHELIAQDFKPDLTLILDLPVDIGLSRAAARAGSANRFERMGHDFHERLRRGFQEIARAEPQRCVLIDATADIAAVQQAIRAAVRARLGVAI